MSDRLSPEDRAEFRRFVEQIFRSGSVEGIESELRDLVVPAPFRLRMKAVYGTEDPYSVVRGLAKSARPLFRSYMRLGPAPPVPWSLKFAGVRGSGFELEGTFGRDHLRQFCLPFALLRTDEVNVRMVVTVATTEHWDQLLRFLRWQYPQLVPIHLTQRELIDGVREYRDDAAGFEVRVREYSAKERGRGGRYSRTVREWTDEEFNSVVEQVYKRNQMVGSIKLALHRVLGDRTSPHPSLYAMLTRDGRVEISGQYRLASRTIVRRLAQIGGEKLKSYSGRGMRQRGYQPAPLRIDFPRNVVNEPGELRQLLQVLKTYPRSMYSVQHGNPYLHIRICDAFDGSGFDVWAVAADSLVVMPRTKSTEAAIERLITHIFEHFREGEVGEFSDA